MVCQAQEIVVAFHKPPGMAAGDTRLQVRILTDPSATPNGRTWQTFAEMTNSELWTDVATGDLDLNGLDELALIDEEASQLSLYRMQGNELVRFYANTSESKHWTDVAIGQVDPSTALPELVIVRSADPPLPSLTVWRYNGNNGFADVYLADFAPSMRVVFLADVTGDGDQEIYMLRDVPVAATTIPQLVMRNLGPPGPVPFEIRLDPNNIFRYGAGGDLDGDGKDEIAVISTAQLRIWDSPDTSTTSRNESVSSNGRTILIGNLDAIGAVKEDRLNATPPRIDRSVAAGTRSEPISIFLSNSTTSNPISFTVTAVPPTPLVIMDDDGCPDAGGAAR